MEIREIKGDVIKLIYNPFNEDLEIGDGIKVIEKMSKRGILCQVIEEETIDYQSIVEEQLRKVAVEKFEKREHIVEGDLATIDLKNLKVAILKIRKQIRIKDGNEIFESWDGWVPSRSSDVTIAKSEEILLKLVEDKPASIRIGSTRDGKDIDIRGKNLEHVNVITSVKGAGKSHLSKVLLWRLIKQGARCIVFDVNAEYVALPKIDEEPDKKGVVVVRLGRDLKVGIVDFGFEKIVSMLADGQSPKSLENFSVEFADKFEDLKSSNEFVPFSWLIERLDLSGMNDMNKKALKRGLLHIKTLGIFAEKKEEASLEILLKKIESGGSIVVDLSEVSPRSMHQLVPVVVNKIKDKVRGGSYHFLFFEEAHTYLEEEDVLDLITRIRHYGASLFFITNTISKLPETALKQIDNLFLLQLLHDEDIRKVSSCGLLDDESIEAFAKKIPIRNVVMVGKNSTQGYPIRFIPDKLDGLRLLGQTRYFFG